jgi:hypothetical protein
MPILGTLKIADYPWLVLTNWVLSFFLTNFFSTLNFLQKLFISFHFQQHLWLFEKKSK